MKKLFIYSAAFLIFGYILFQNWNVWLLKIISFGSNSGQGNTVANTNGPMPPYKDGTYGGNVADAFYGNLQVQAIIQNGKITDVTFLQYPSDRSRSVAINSLAMPSLKQEAIQAQSANVDIVSGATASSQAFIQSMQNALSQAK